MKKVILTILDGFGCTDMKENNAIYSAKTENLDHLFNEFKYSKLVCSGGEVGLPEGTMGNSEVGHLNIGAGRVVYQDISKIDKDIKDGSFEKNKSLVEVIDYAKNNSKSVHLMGLISDGGVHSSLEHLKELIRILKSKNDLNFFIHAFTDGRDTPPNSGLEFIREIEDSLVGTKGRIASVIGRFYVMDRDKRWERVSKAYDALVNGNGEVYESAVKAMEESYKKDTTDEFILPSKIDNGSGISNICEGDAVIFFNFRADRAREITLALNDENFTDFPVKKLYLNYVTMTRYRDDFTYKTIVPKMNFSNILGEVISKNGLNQLRIAETEKYAHVTFFFNGGVDVQFENEDRILIPSPKVETYDLQPEMSALEVKDNVLKALDSEKYDLIILNFANCDMVGHTGIFDAAVKAVETIDQCVGEIYRKTVEKNYTFIMTADHGNAEKMLEDGVPFTAHTKNPVPFMIASKEYDPMNGKLADIAPTILKIMGVEQPEEMDGESLV